MGNISSCVSPQSNSAQVIDLHRNILRLVDVPLTAAELMLENPGYVLSPFAGLGCDRRFSAIKADELLSGGRLYLLIPVSRVNGKVSESEMAAIESACGRRSSKRRSSRIQPVVNNNNTCTSTTDITEGISDNSPPNILGKGGEIGILRCRARQWKPALEPIYEGI